MTVNIIQASALSQIAAQDRQALRQVWETIQPDSCPYSYNFHMHTTCSDGRLMPEDLLEQAVNIGLKGLAITDHHSVRGYRRAQSWLEQHQQDFLPSTPMPHLWTGVEITSDLVGTEVHILGYAFDPKHPSLEPYLQGRTLHPREAQASDVIESIHQAGGLAVLAHPGRYRRSAEELVPIAANFGIDGVETYYAYTNPNPWTPSVNQTQRVKQLSDRYNLLNTCGTDTHGSNLLMRL